MPHTNSSEFARIHAVGYWRLVRAQFNKSNSTSFKNALDRLSSLTKAPIQKKDLVEIVRIYPSRALVELLSTGQIRARHHPYKKPKKEPQQESRIYCLLKFVCCCGRGGAGGEESRIPDLSSSSSSSRAAPQSSSSAQVKFPRIDAACDGAATLRAAEALAG